MPFLITSAAGANADGLGVLLTFFSDDSRIVDPRGLAVNWSEGFLFLNSGSDRLLALHRLRQVLTRKP
jgi:hypothetical protein